MWGVALGVVVLCTFVSQSLAPSVFEDTLVDNHIVPEPHAHHEYNMLHNQYCEVMEGECKSMIRDQMVISTHTLLRSGMISYGIRVLIVNSIKGSN